MTASIVSLAQDFELDHSIMVPLHFLTPDMNVPIVPFFINGLAPPLPSSQRCYALGKAVRPRSTGGRKASASP